MKKNILFLLFFLVIPNLLFSDRSSYRKTVDIAIESENYIIKHHHNWKDKIAYIEGINKKTNSIIFKVSAPALTKLFISNDEKYIIGLSKIKLENPYQLFILSIDGECIFKRHISDMESKLTQNNYLIFIEKYPEEFKYLESMNSIYAIGECYFIDFLDSYQFLVNGAWNYLLEYLSKNHLSNNFSESVTNHIYWYNETSPGLECIYNDNELIAISLLDQKNEKIVIEIKR